MKRATKKKSALYQYLEPFLQEGTDEAIANAKEQYWKDYKKRWKLEKYKDTTCFKILLTPAELTIVSKAAKQHRTSRTGFIKNAAVIQAGKSEVVDKATLAQVREALVLHYSSVEELLDEQEDTPIFTDYLLHITEQLQGTVLHILNGAYT